MIPVLHSICLFVGDDTDIQAAGGTLDITLSPGPYAPALEIHGDGGASDAERYGRLHDFFVRCAEACQGAVEAEALDAEPECGRCGDSGEIQVGPAPYDTDECPACTNRMPVR